MKFILIHLRKSLKLIFLLLIGAFLILLLLYFLYKPMYAVYIDGELVGYTEEREALQEELTAYVKSGDDEVAFYEIDSMPTYEICYSKKDNTANDDEIVDIVLANATAYYKQYAIYLDKDEKYCVATYEEAEEIIKTLKEKKSTNISKISYSAIYTADEKKEETATDTVVSKLYVKPVEKKTTTTTTTTTTSSSSSSSSGSYSTSANVSYSKVSLGITLQKPVSGTITSRFGERSSIRSSVHTGLDIGASKGTTIKAAATGTVTFAGWKGSYGYLIVLSHGNGVQTYYGHCSKLSVSAGETVSAGQKIGEVGSTGNSTGPHLHFEIRVNGVAYNPQKYLY